MGDSQARWSIQGHRSTKNELLDECRIARLRRFVGERFQRAVKPESVFQPFPGTVGIQLCSTLVGGCGLK